MKTINLCLFFAVFEAAAQVPNAPQSAVPLPPQPIAVRTNFSPSPTGTTGTVGDSSPTTRTTPRITTQPRANSIINPSPASTNVVVTNVPGGFTVINPSRTNAPPEETVSPGVIDIRKMDLDTFLGFYADLFNKVILRA